MSAVYPIARETIFGWAINADAPADIEVKVIGVDSTYVYNAAHSDLTDLGATTVTPGVVIPNLTYVNGIIDGDDTDVSGLSLSDDIAAAIIYMEWPSPAGTLLMAHIDQSSDGSLPQTIDSTTGRFKFAAGGIFRI